MSSWIYDVIHQGGYFGIFFLMALENIFPPIPSELIMGLGGLAVARNDMGFVPLLVAGTAGATLGNYVLYLVSYKLGYRRLEPVVARWGRWLTLEWDDVERMRGFLKQHGHWIVFALRMLPMFRTVISIPAGLARMGHIRFLAFTALGTAIWNVALVAGGLWLGRTFDQAETWLGYAAFAAMGAALVWYIWRVVTWKSKSIASQDS